MMEIKIQMMDAPHLAKKKQVGNVPHLAPPVIQSVETTLSPEQKYVIMMIVDLILVATQLLVLNFRDMIVKQIH